MSSVRVFRQAWELSADELACVVLAAGTDERSVLESFVWAINDNGTVQSWPLSPA